MKKKIIYLYIEIALVFTLLCISIPIWRGLENKFNSITTLDDYKMVFKEEETFKGDILTVSNPYYINKNYRIKMALKKDFDISSGILNINDEVYNLNDFDYELDFNKIIINLINKTIPGGTEVYIINTNIPNSDYEYIFEESYNF